MVRIISLKYMFVLKDFTRLWDSDGCFVMRGQGSERMEGGIWSLLLVSESMSTQCISFTVKFFKASYFPNYMMDLVYIWYVDRYKSKVLFTNIHNHTCDLKVKVKDLELYVKVLQ